MSQNIETDQILNNNNSDILNKLSLSDIEIAKSSILYCNDCNNIKEMDGLADFKTVDGKIKKLEYRKLADGAYDQTFKLLFAWEKEVDKINGKSRLKSLLNSFFFPDAGKNGFKIRKIEYLRNENDMSKFEIPCECTCWSEEINKDKKKYDIKIQIGYPLFFGEMNEYSYSFQQKNDNVPVIILSFLNYDYFNPKEILQKGEVIGSKMFYVNRDDNHIEKMSNDLNIYYFYLSHEKNYLLSNKPIKIRGKEINKTGREWLKLLSMRHWATPYKDNGTIRYLFPKDTLKVDENIISAMKILERLNDEDLIKCIQDEKHCNSLLETSIIIGLKEGKKESKKEGEKEGLKEGLKEGKKEGLKEGKKEVKRKVLRKVKKEKLKKLQKIL